MTDREKLIGELEGQAENSAWTVMTRNLFTQAAQMLREDGEEIERWEKTTPGIIKTLEKIERLRSQRDKLTQELEEARN